MNMSIPTKSATGPTAPQDVGSAHSEAMPLVNSGSIQVEDLSEPLAPTPYRLSRCAEIGHGALYAARVTGSTMFSTGLTANICRHMMNNPNAKKSEGLLIGLGILAFLTGAVGQASTVSSERRETIKQSLKDAVVPAIVSFSVYLALSHGAI